MRKLVFGSLPLLTLLASCSSSNNGELIGVQDRPPWFQDDPYGTVLIPLGAFHMGASDEEVPYTQNNSTKVVSVQSFYMDETEITNNEYRQFTNWVRDSIAHRLIGDDHILDEGEYDERIDWEAKIRWGEEDVMDVLGEELFIMESERYYKRKEADARRLNYEYWWIDYDLAASKANRYQYLDENKTTWEYGNGYENRGSFIFREVVAAYPDTLVWVHDLTYSFNVPMTQMYNWHPAYDHYPVVGVNWLQAVAFCKWRTRLFNVYRESRGRFIVNDFRLPTETEWEYAARGGKDNAPYPWGGPYIRNVKGCFLGNFKPLRGNYVADGGLHTIMVGHYWPNDFGLYDMAGNVAEWTKSAYEESAYNFSHDINQHYEYRASEGDPPALKRKTIRGGSWKDIGYYMQNGTRAYEYQDTTKSYVGFRCVQTYLGRKQVNGPESNVY